MPRINSRAKGAAYEREVANDLRARGYQARRGQQHAGGPDSPDVVGLPGYHIEAKRTERLDLYGAMDQAVRDADLFETPVVVHRKNGRRSVAIVDWQAFLDLVEAARKT